MQTMTKIKNVLAKKGIEIEFKKGVEEMNLIDLYHYYKSYENIQDEFIVRGSSPLETIFYQIGEVWVDRKGSERLFKLRDLYDESALKIIKADRVVK